MTANPLAKRKPDPLVALGSAGLGALIIMGSIIKKNYSNPDNPEEEISPPKQQRGILQLQGADRRRLLFRMPLKALR